MIFKGYPINTFSQRINDTKLSTVRIQQQILK